MDVFFLGLFDPLNETAPPEPIDDFYVPVDFADAQQFAKTYNQLASKDPLLKKLVAVFPVPQFAADIRSGQPDVVFQGRGQVRMPHHSL